MDPEHETLKTYLRMSLLGLLVLGLVMGPASALRDPAAVYCKALGYHSSVALDAGGNEVTMCILPDGRAVDGWHFLRGTAAQEYSYCAREGLVQKTVASRTTCAQFLTDTCAVCVKKDGTEVEVTTLMGLSFAETTCGDGTCGFPESYATCPGDCPSAGWDMLCQPQLDGRCDRDCSGQNSDPDCMYLGNPLLTILVIIILLCIALGIWYLLRKRKEKNS
jgi:putative hemolysin